LYLTAWADREELSFYELLLDPSFPSTVRAAALHAIFHVTPPLEIPAAVRALAGDVDLGPVLKIYRYLEPPEP
jgi:hypothetical protein